MRSKLAIAHAFLTAKWQQRATRAQILAGQPKRNPETPITNPQDYEANFHLHNALGLTLEEARSLARQQPEANGYTLGLSSGTTGEPGVFLTTAAERNRFIGTILAKFLSPAQLWNADVALVLKHNNRLYSDVAQTSRIRLHYFDLTRNWAEPLRRLKPRIVIGPPSALMTIAANPGFQPHTLLTGAEPLYPHQRAALEAGFQTAPRGVYQAREGFLATGCKLGQLHWNEDLIQVELMRFQADPQRAVPVITDFTRTSQRYHRYRMDDVIRLADKPCPCGLPFASFQAVEGRWQDVIIHPDGRLSFPFDLYQTHGPEVALTQLDPHTIHQTPARPPAPGAKYRPYRRLFPGPPIETFLLPPEPLL